MTAYKIKFLFLPILLTLLFVTQGAAQTEVEDEPLNLREFTRPDGKVEIYYAAGNDFMIYALRELDDYYYDQFLFHYARSPSLPLELKALDHKPAIAMMKKEAEYLRNLRHPQTNLIPFPFEGWSDTWQVDRTGKQHVSAVLGLVEFLEWFPDDPELLQATVDVAEATMTYFDYEIAPGQKGGLVNWVDIETGVAHSDLVLAQSIGEVGEAFARLSQITGDPQYIDWADQKLEFVWQERVTPPFPMLAEQFYPWGHNPTADGGDSSSTDTLYYLHRLFTIYHLTENPKYGRWAVATADFWYEHDWMAEYGHFSSKLNKFTGKPLRTDLYNDSKDNTLRILTEAYEVTHDEKYLERLKFAWTNLRAMGRDGFFPTAVDKGVMEEERGLENAQTLLLLVLIEAYQASDDPEFLALAEEFGRHLLENRPDLIRMAEASGPKTYLQLALLSQNIHRLEVELDAPEAVIIVNQGNETLLNETVPGDIAVIYLPEGDYQIEIIGETGLQSWDVHLGENKKLRDCSSKLLPAYLPLILKI